MAERWTRASKDDLEAALVGLGREVAFPAPPEVVAMVAQRLRALPAPERVVVPLRGRSALRPLIRPAWQRVVVVPAAVVLLFSAVLTFSPTSRRAVADFLGLRGVRIHRVPTPPAASIRPLGDGLDLGERVTLAEAQSRVSYRVLVPSVAELGPPDEVYLRQTALGDQVSLVYRARPGVPRAGATGVGLLVTEFRARLNSEFIDKFLGPGSTLEAVRVNGSPGFWISGAPHAILYVGINGEPIPDTVRLAANVLVWERGAVTVRIESLLTKDQALEIARSTR
jgi:hypothetical protein